MFAGSPTLGSSYRISRLTLPTPQPDPTVELFCFEKQSFSFQAWIGLITSGLNWLLNLPTRQGIVYTSRLFLFSGLNYPYLVLISFSYLPSMQQLPCKRVPFKTFCPPSHQCIPGLPTFQYPSSVFLLAPKHLSVAPNFPVRLCFRIFLVILPLLGLTYKQIPQAPKPKLFHNSPPPSPPSAMMPCISQSHTASPGGRGCYLGIKSPVPLSPQTAGSRALAPLYLNSHSSGLYQTGYGPHTV